MHIGISAKIKTLSVPFHVGYFKIPDGQDLKKTASIACKKYSEKKEWPEFITILQSVEVYDRITNQQLFKIKL